MIVIDGLKGWGKEGEEDPVKTSRNDPNYAEEGEQHISANEIEVGGGSVLLH